jgi:hypothetical protein
VETVAEMGMRAVSDVEHLRYAAHNNRTLYSFSRRDFLRIHSEFLGRDESHAGIILLGRRTNDIGAQLRGLVTVATTHGQAGMANWLQFI